MSTWSGISTALSALRTQRVAIEVAGQNIANVNTPGYARQRVDMTAGIGVDVSAISRLHNAILGDRSRTEGAQLQDERSGAITKLAVVIVKPNQEAV